LQSRASKKERTLGRPNFDEMAYSWFGRIRMIGMQRHESVWFFRERPLNSFEVFEQIVIKVLAQA